MQERRNSIASARELRLSCTNPSICSRHNLACKVLKQIFVSLVSYIQSRPSLASIPNITIGSCGSKHFLLQQSHYSNVIMSVMVSQITGVSIVCSNVCSGVDQRKHQSSASLAFERGIHRLPSQRASNAENVPIWWRHHVLFAKWLTTSLQKIYNRISAFGVYLRGEVTDGSSTQII